MRRFITYIVFLLPLCLLNGCREQKTVDAEKGQGWLSVEFLLDKSLVTRAENAKYNLEVQQLDGTLVGAYDCEHLSERILLPKGTYRLVALSDKGNGVGFETPVYRGEKEVEIKAGVTQSVSMTCTLANVKMTVEYSDKIRQNFPDYTLEVNNGTSALTFLKDDRRAGYLPVNEEGTLHWVLKLHNGQEEYALNKTITDVAPRQCYNFKFDINETAGEDEGAFVGGIVVDTTLDIYQWECVVNLKAETAKPEIKLMGADGQLKDLSEKIVVLDETRGADVRVHVAAQATMQELILRHKSEEVQKMGVPSQVDLIGISDETKAKLNNAGIVWGNEALLDKEEAIIDFSGIANRLPLGEYEFYLNVFGARNRMALDTLRIQVVPDMEHAAQGTVRHEVWATFATVSGRWYTQDCPAGLTFEYSTDQTQWNRVENSRVQFNDAEKSCSAVLTGLTPGQTYYYRTIADASESPEVKAFTTEEALQVPYLNFDTWFTGEDKKTLYLGEKSNKIWDSGNKGANTMGTNNPTVPDKTTKVNKAGNESSAYLETKVVASVMAAGNIYTGDFVKAEISLSNPGAQLDFGIPYTCRPTTLSGYYKYQPVNINQAKAPYSHLKGQMDSCYIYVALFADWDGPFRVNTKTGTFVNLSEAIAYGEVKDSRTMNDFEPFTIKLEYRDKTKIPNYILIVATASKYGDYFTGGEGSKLWIDEFELGFNPIE